MSQWVAGLPMYNVTPRLGAAWRALLVDTLAAFARAGGPRGVELLGEPFGELLPLWRREDLLLSQTCGYPFRMLGLDALTHLVATPVFDVEGCEGARYSSWLVVSAAAQAGGAVLDGRDIGTVIAPGAPAKLFVTATPEVSATRRWKQLTARGDDIAFEDMLADIQRRDERDAGRGAAPMVQAQDAALLDTTDMGIEAAFDAARRIVEAARARHGL